MRACLLAAAGLGSARVNLRPSVRVATSYLPVPEAACAGAASATYTQQTCVPFRLRSLRAGPSEPRCSRVELQTELSAVTEGPGRRRRPSNQSTALRLKLGRVAEVPSKLIGQAPGSATGPARQGGQLS